MRHPAQYWIKYLLSKDVHTYEQIRGIMEMFSLGAVTSELLDQLEDSLAADKPSPFRPRTKSHKPSQSYLRRHGIYKAWHRDSAMNLALDIMSDQPSRSLVEVFILSPVPAEQAVAKINDQISSLSITVEAYERFRHYFWNNQLLSAAEWGDYVQSRNDSHKDWLKLAVNAKGPQGVQLLLWKTGAGAIKNVDRARVFTDFRNIAYMKAKELEHCKASAEDSKALLNYARVAKTAQEEVNNSSDAVRDVLESFNTFRMRRSGLQAPSLKQLTGGDYTTAEDVAALEDKIEY